MISSTSFSTRPWLILALLWIGISACAVGHQRAEIPPLWATDRIAVMPIYHLGGTPAPLDDIRRRLVSGLNRAGFDLVAEDELQAFIRRHRLRYVGGIDRETAAALRTETGARAVLITSLEFYNAYPPPKISIAWRLVATDETLRILWTDGVGLAGDDHPGLLELGMIEDPRALLEIASNHLVSSLARQQASPKTPAIPPVDSALPPDTAYRNPSLLSTAGPRVAVLPFLNSSLRKHAGEIVALQFLRSLGSHPEYELLEPGAIRETLLEARIVMGDGISLADAQILFSRLNVDLLLSGQVLQYEDYQGPSGKARVCFSATLFERSSRRTAWNVQSCKDGEQRVWFFDFGKYRTAHALAGAMAEGAVRSIQAE
jgi:hypothetical protein